MSHTHKALIIDCFGDGERLAYRVHARERGFWWRRAYHVAQTEYRAQCAASTLTLY